jgi:phage repressor protein C with HTH and peptisase S24 domain
MKIGGRVEAEMKRRDWSEGELARRTGVSQPTIHRILKGESKSPRHENVQAIAKAFGCTPEWLWTGVGKAPTESSTQPRSLQTSAAEVVLGLLQKHATKGLSPEAQEKIAQAVQDSLSEQLSAPGVSSNVVDADFSRFKPRKGDISIPQYDVRGSMGHGQLPADYVETIKNVTINEAHLKESGVTYSSAAALAMITGWGQSMEGTINDKDPLIVDRGVNEFVGDGIYVLTWHGHLYIKRVQVADEDHFELISDNPKHKDRIALMGDVTFHARVLIVWNAKKL